MRIARNINARPLHLCIFLSSCLFFSDVCTAKMHLFDQIKDINMLDQQENHVTFTSPESNAQLDDTGDVPVVNPTTPGFGMSPTTPGSGMNPPATTTPNVNPITPSPPDSTEPVTNPPPTSATPASSGGSWCIANPTASETALQVALDYACGYGGADCSAIQPGATCFEPNTVKDHASYAFNDYYHKNPGPTSCVFGGAAQLTNTDPSHGGCHFASSTGTATTPPTTIPPLPPTPPSIMSPINPYTPGGPTGYGSEPSEFGSEPTGTPSAAKSISFHLSLLSTMTYFMLWLVAGSYI